MPYKTTYAQRKADGRCPHCPRPVGKHVLCDACTAKRNDYQRTRYAQHRRTILALNRQTREARWEAPGANLIACCDGAMHPILSVPGPPPALITACCRRVLGVIPAAEVQP